VQARVIDWDGTNLPKELRELPPGQYRLEAVDDVTDLTPAEEAGIRLAMDQIDAGQGISLEEAVRRIRSRSRQR
jgi:hypothetical protein